MTRVASTDWFRFLLSLTALVMLFALCGGTIRFWDRSGFVLVSGGRELGMLAGVLITAAAFLFYRNRDLPSLLMPSVFLWGVVLFFLSDWLTRNYNLVHGADIRGEIILCAIASWVVCRLRAWWLIGVFAFLCIFGLVYSFFEVSNGALLFSDDHTMFLFRLALLRDNFPSIPFWSPLWNGGFDARDFFATGALNVFLLSWPILYTLPIELAYNVIVVGILFFLVPFSTWLAASVMELSRRGRICSSILAIASSLFWYRWGLKYGTMGFITSAALAPLVITLGTQLLYDNPVPSLRRVALFVAVTSLMLLWSPSGALLLPFIFLFVVQFRLPTRLQRIALVALLLINVPWMVMLWRVSKVSSFLGSETKVTQRDTTAIEDPAKSSTETKETETTATTAATKKFRHRASGFDKKIALEKLQEAANATNPILLLLAVPALALLPSRFRRVYLLTGGWLLILGTVGVSFKPQLELDRMLVLLALLLAIPVGKFLDEYVFPAVTSARTSVPAALTLGMAAVSPFSAMNVVLNRSIEQYYFADETVKALSDTLATHSKGARAIFTGCVLHQLSGGHLGPLVYFSKTPLVASSFAHNIWTYRQIIPASFLKRGDQGIVDYFDTMNASLVVAHEAQWLEYFRKRPEGYRELWHGGRFAVFERIGFSSNYFLRGEGEVLSQDTNSVVVKLATPDAVLKFVYFDFIEASGCHALPFDAVPNELQLVALSHCPVGVPITIKARPSWTRMLH